MASGQLWLIWAVLGHDAIQALHEPPLTRRLNHHIAADLRATLNSVANLTQRLVFAITGPLVGTLVDHAGLQTGFVVLGAVASGLSLNAALRLSQLNTFSNRR
jgi:sugar phosphate permease